MQIFIGRVYMGTDMDKQDKTRTPCSALIIAYYRVGYIGRIFWGHIRLLWGRDVARWPPFEQHCCIHY